MKVTGIVTYRVFPPLMGGQKGVALFYGHLKNFVAVSLLLSADNQPPPFNHERLLFSNRKMYGNAARYGLLKKCTQHWLPDVLIAEHSYAGWLAFLLSRSLKIPFVIHSHNMEGERFRQMHRRWWRLYAHYEKWIHRKADFNFFIHDDDRRFAVRNFKLQPARCATVTYGIDKPERILSWQQAREKLGLASAQPFIYFNGTLDYEPNVAAIELLFQEILPRLQQTRCMLLVTGNRASEALAAKLHAHPQIIFLAYVPDVAACYQAAQLFINPMPAASGIKTKVLEALANHCTVLSTVAGAEGIDAAVCGNKLQIVPAGDWDDFAGKINPILALPPQQTPPHFFEKYLWDNIAAAAAAHLQHTVEEYGKSAT